MTISYAYYSVAYLHPSVSEDSRIERIKLDSEASGEILCELLKSIYKEQSSDLERATLWKASRLVVAQLPP